VIAESGVSKVTFYRHFRTKDDLVVAYLDELSASELEQFDDARERLDDATLWRWYVDSVVSAGCLPGFRGCAFINAAAEYAGSEHPVRRAVVRHRGLIQKRIAELAERLGATDPVRVAQEIQLVRDGALVLASLEGGTERIGPVLDDAGRRLLSA
jgi:AcrR family transcriptional regulator